MNLRIKELLFPTTGLTLDPPAPEEVDVRADFADLGINLLLGKTTVGSAVIQATSTGALKIADTGAGLESYDTETGTTADAYAAGQTHENASGWNYGRLLVEREEVVVSLKDSAGNWGDDISFLVGNHEVAMTFYGIKLKSRDPGFDGDYEFWGMT